MICYLLMDLLLFYQFLGKDMVLHHVLSLLLAFSFQSRTKEEQLAFLLTEVSTPFLVLYRLGICKNLTKMCFLLSFIYFRVYGLGVVLWKERYSTQDLCVWNGYALWLVNLYWFEIIMRHAIGKDKISFLQKITPFSHFLTPCISLFFSKYDIVFWMIGFFSAFMSYYWHSTKHWYAYVMDLFGLHLLSFAISYYATEYSILSLISIPFHMSDVFYYYEYHREFLLLSIGWDVMLVFYYTNNFMWLCTWIMIAMFNSHQTFGWNSTQCFVHIGTAIAICLL